MSSLHRSSLRSRKPFKLLLHFGSDELKQMEEELQDRDQREGDAATRKLRVYFQRWLELRDAPEPLTRAQFVAGTDLPTSANAFDKLTSRFYTYLQEFLARGELARDLLARQHLAFRAYRDRGMDWQEVRRRHAEASRELDKLPQSSRLYHARILLDLDFATLSSDRNVSPDQRGYNELLTALDANYVIQKLRLLCAVINDRKIFKDQAAASFHPIELPLPQETWPPLAHLYHWVYQMQTGRDGPEVMDRLHHLLDQQDPASTDYPAEDMLDLYGYLLNGLARRVNNGDAGALKDLSRLHDHLVDREILLEKGRIDAQHFKNILSVKHKTGEIEGMRRLFEALAEKVTNDAENNAVRYNHALLMFAEKKLEKAAKELENLYGQVNNLKLDLFYGLDIRMLLLKAYFDLLDHPNTPPRVWDDTDEKMVRLLDACKGYIERRKIPENRRKKYDSSRRLIQAIYSVRFRSGGQREMEELQGLVRDFPKVIDNWFRARLVQMGLPLPGA